MQRADNRRKGIHMLAGARLQLISGLSNKENGKKGQGSNRSIPSRRMEVIARRGDLNIALRAWATKRREMQMFALRL